MQNRNHKINIIVLYSIYILINTLFITKYLMRISLPITTASIITYLLGCYVLIKYLNHQQKVSNKLFMLSFCLFTIILISIQYSINPYKIQVDRWSAIYNFIDYLLQGKYPYLAQTHLGGYGSPFPFWQFIHIPFYYLNNIGLSIFLMLGYALYSIKKIYNTKTSFIFFILLAFSPAFLYEIIVRSDLIANFLFILAIMNTSFRLQKKLSNCICTYAIVLGLLLSTRLSVSIPFFIWLFPAFIGLTAQQKTCLTIGIITIFCMTFLPFIFWDANNLLFFQYNPFILQTRQGSTLSLVILTICMLYLSLTWKNKKELLYRNIGYGLFILVLVTFSVNMLKSGNYMLFDSAYDISYLNMSLPFILQALVLLAFTQNNRNISHQDFFNQ